MKKEMHVHMSLNLTNTQQQQTQRNEAKRAIKSCEYTLRSHIKEAKPSMQKPRNTKK
jgi:hypothetical protein